MSVVPKKILVLGSNSYASSGLIDCLKKDGHTVTTFNWGDIGREGDGVTGPVLELCANPGLTGSYDVVINYILMKGCSIEENGAYIDELLQFCGTCRAHHLIHISSMSVYSESNRHVTELSAVETVPGNKGAYGALKVVQDLHLLQRKDRELKVTFIRPGFILGRGLQDPVVGMATRIGFGLMLMFGRGKNVVPVAARELVCKAVSRVAAMEPVGPEQVVMVVDPDSPGRREWVTECCRCAGLGKAVLALPRWMWQCVAFGGEIFVRLIGKKIRPMNIVSNMFREMTFNASASEALLGMSFSCDWREELSKALEPEKENP